MHMRQRGFSLVEGLLIVLVVAVVGFGGWYVWNESQDNEAEEEQIVQQVDNNEETEEEAEPTVYNSNLYPSLSFDVPAGWEVNEPTEYDESTWGPGWANGVIKISNSDSTLNLRLTTIPATGFEGYTCTKEDSLTAVNGIYRYLSGEGVVYRNGVSKDDDDWIEASQSEYSNSVDSNPNFCVLSPFLGVHESKLLQADFTEQPYGFTDREKVLVWLEADVEGNISQQALSVTDDIVSTLSQSVTQ
jgi:hypothetical protein